MIEAFLNYLKFEKRYSTKTVESYKIDILQFSFLKLEFEQDDLLPVRKNKSGSGPVVQLVNDKHKPTSIKRKISATLNLSINTIRRSAT